MTEGISIGLPSTRPSAHEPWLAREFELPEEMVRAIRDSAQAHAQALDRETSFDQTWHEIRDLDTGRARDAARRPAPLSARPTI